MVDDKYIRAIINIWFDFYFMCYLILSIIQITCICYDDIVGVPKCKNRFLQEKLFSHVEVRPGWHQSLESNLKVTFSGLTVVFALFVLCCAKLELAL